MHSSLVYAQPNSQPATLLEAEFSELLAPVLAFLHCETPTAWLEQAQKPENLAIILRDHLLCEQ